MTGALEACVSGTRIVQFFRENRHPRISHGSNRPTLSLPMPLFTRNPEERRSFFTNWLETSIIRDAARAYGARYNPDIAWSVLRQMGTVLAEGEIPTLKHFKQGSRSLRKYLQALEDIFLLQKLNPHDASVAREVWLPTDTGIAAHLMGGTMGEGRSLSLGRIFVLKEIRAVAEYSGKRIQPLYYKSARGSPVDLIPLRPRPRFQILSLATGRCFHSSSIRRDRDGLPDCRSTPAWRGVPSREPGGQSLCKAQSLCPSRSRR
jgi:hypothetical protein